MTVPKLKYPVCTLGGQQLLREETSLTPDVMDALVASGRSASNPSAPLLDHGTVRQDLAAFLRQGAYGFIFNDPRKLEILMNLMGKVRLVRPLLDALDYFRRHDGYTYSHVLRVFAMTILISQDLERDFEDLILEATAGPLHDIGKICVPLRILRKSTPLRRSERAVLEHHATAGFVLLSYYMKDPRAIAARVAGEHHERKDGSGYPLGIPLTDRLVEIVVACDVYDALLSPRPYRRVSYDNRTALEEITEMGARGKIDWEIVQALVSRNRRGRPPAGECKVSLEKRGTPPEGNLYGLVTEDAETTAEGPA